MSNKESSTMANKEPTAITNKESSDVKQLPNIFINLYITSVYTIPRSTKSILSETVSPQISSNIDYPKFSLGFQHYVHAKKEALDTLSQFDGKKKVYNVINKFNKQIDDYDTDIDKISKSFFGLEISNDNFFGAWETLHMFNLIPTGNKFKSCHMMENGSMLQAIICFRDKYAGSDAKGDSYNVYNKLNDDDHHEAIDKKLLSHYSKEKTNRISVETKQPKKMNLVTLNLGSNWKFRNMKEQDSLLLFLKQLLASVEMLDNDGNLLCEIFETFTLSTNKILCALTEIFKQVSIVKPLSTNPAIDNKYLVCMGYNQKGTKFNEFLEAVIKVLEHNPKKFVVNFFPKYEFSKEFISVIRKANTDISNRQFMDVNKILEFIKKENYYGDIYQRYRSEQIKASNMWIEKFLVEKKIFDNKSKQIRDETNEIIKTNHIRANLIDSKL